MFWLMAELRMAHTASFFGDEIHSLKTAQQPWREIILDSLSDNHPPLHNLLLGLWLRLVGTSELNSRILSILFGLGLVYALALLARYLAGPSAGHLCFAVGLCSPCLALYGWTLRWYIPVAALEMVSLVLLFTCWGRDSWWLWLAYMLTLGATFYMDYSALFFLPCHWLFMIWLAWNRGKGATKRVLLAQAIAGLFFLPWFLLVVWKMLQNSGGLDRSPVAGGVLGKVAYAVFAFTVGQTTLPFNYVVLLAGGAFFVFLSLVLVKPSSRNWRSLLIPPTILLGIPPILALLWKPGLFQPHYFLASAGGGVVFLSLVLAKTQVRWLRVGMMVALAVMWGIGLINWQLGRDYQRSELVDKWREVAAVARIRIKPDTIVIYTHSSFFYYLRSPGIRMGPTSNLPVRTWTQQRPSGILIEYSPLSGYDPVLTQQYEELCRELGGEGWQQIWEQGFNREAAWEVKRRFLHREVPEWRTWVVLYKTPSP